MSAAGLPLFVVETVVYTYAAMDLLSFIIIMGRGYRRSIKKKKTNGGPISVTRDVRE